MYDSHFVCSNCSPPVFAHLFSRGVITFLPHQVDLVAFLSVSALPAV